MLTYGDALARYGFGAGHPVVNEASFTTGSVHSGMNARRAAWTGARRLWRRCRPANRTSCVLHTRAYVARVKMQSVDGEGFLDYGETADTTSLSRGPRTRVPGVPSITSPIGDTPAFPGMYEAAAAVVGSTLDAVAHSVSGAAPRAFTPIAGLHHARREMAAGFCVFIVATGGGGYNRANLAAAWCAVIEALLE
jgi:acetoin utilization protein AcuC